MAKRASENSATTPAGQLVDEPANTAQKLGRGVTKAVKVWHIREFEQRFEMDEDSRQCRQSALVFIRVLVHSVDSVKYPWCANYSEQISTLMAEPNGHVLHSVFIMLVKKASERYRRYRGFLLDGQMLPATNRDIARWTNLTVPEIKKVLKQLSKVGLIERVDLPEFDTDSDQTPKKPDEKDDRKTTSKSKKKDSAGSSGKTRKNLGKSGETPDAFKKTRTATTTLTKTKKKTAKKKKLSKTASAEKANDQSNPKAKQQPEAKPSTTQSCEVERVGEQQSKSLSPSASPPSMPTESDSGVAVNTLPSQSSYQQRPQSAHDKNPPVRLGAILNQKQHRYNPESRAFAHEIYDKLGLGYPKDSPQAQRELHNFAAAWMQAQGSGLGGVGLEELRAKSVKNAMKIRKGGKARKPAAVWRSTFNKRLGASGNLSATG